jgi:cytochrome c
MKKTILVSLIISTIIFSCSQNNDEQKKETEKTVPENSLANNPDYHKGTVLYLKNDCSTCHAANTRVAGPSYAEVAAKYKGDTTMIPILAERIIKGGKGVWGEVEMPAHPNLSKEDAIALVKYVYLLKE